MAKINEMVRAKMEQILMLRTGIDKEAADWLLDSCMEVQSYVGEKSERWTPHLAMDASEMAIVQMRLNVPPKAAVSQAMHDTLRDTILADDVDKDVIANLPEPTFAKLPVYQAGQWM